MSIFNYFVFSLLVFYQFQSGQSGVPDKLRIIRGDFAFPGEIKYIVVTLHDDQYYKCGGGIIHNYYVLTAAHCFINDNDRFDDKSVKVVAGIIDYNDKEDPRRVEVDVEKIYTPRDYHSYGYPNDIAVLKLKESLNITDNDLQKLSLPRKARKLDNHMALMAGFGYDKHETSLNFRTFQVSDEYSSSGLLRKADIKMYSNTKCQEFYEKDEIYDSYLCGKMVKESQRREYGVCNGDSGSPLVFKSKEVVGVVSWSYGCDERDVPLVYTKVHSFLDFISNARKGITKDMRVRSFK